MSTAATNPAREPLPTPAPAGPFRRGRSAAAVAVLLAAALVAWIVTLQRMRGMDAGPGTDPGGFGWYLGIWVTMMAAMMLPSEARAVAIFARLRGDAQTAVFVLGYLLAWTVCGIAAYVAYRGARAAEPSFLAWDEEGPWVAGGALAAAGLYQLTPLKSACLRHCRSPLHFLLRGSPGALGALRTGGEHGAVCIGCCGGLMLALFALGIMSLTWMGALAIAIAVEKVLPGGATFARALAVALVALGIWVALAPASVPGLTQPGGMQMGMQTGKAMDDGMPLDAAGGGSSSKDPNTSMDMDMAP